MSFSSRIDDLLTSIADDTADVVEQQLQFYDVNDIVAVMAKRLLDVEEGVGTSVFNVKSSPFNAAADGVTDDTAAIQAAIDSASGGVCFLPAGSYAFSNLTGPADGGVCAIRGAGPDLTFLGPINGSTGVAIDLTLSSAKPGFDVSGLSLNLTNAPTMIGLRTQKLNRNGVRRCNFRYGSIGWEHVQIQGSGPTFGDWVNFQNQTDEAFHLTGTTGLGSAGRLSNCWIQVTDSAVTMAQGVLVDWFTVGWTFNNVQVLASNSSNLNIHSGIVYNTAAPTGAQGAFLYLTNCVADQMDTGNGLDLTNARGVWSTGNFWSTLSGNSKDGVAITAGKEQFYSNDWISGRGMSFSSAPDKITVGAGCTFPQTSTGGALVMPGSSPPTNLIVSPASRFYTSITNDVPKLATATGYGWGWGRSGIYT